MAGFQQHASQLGDVSRRTAYCQACEVLGMRSMSAVTQSLGSPGQVVHRQRRDLPQQRCDLRFLPVLRQCCSECGQATGRRRGVGEHSMRLPARAGRAQSPQMPSGRAGLGQQLRMRVTGREAGAFRIRVVRRKSDSRSAECQCGQGGTGRPAPRLSRQRVARRRLDRLVRRLIINRPLSVRSGGGCRWRPPRRHPACRALIVDLP
ncbi:hypothetical protein STENM327S_02972 [Streptomyces tendae]